MGHLRCVILYLLYPNRFIRSASLAYKANIKSHNIDILYMKVCPFKLYFCTEYVCLFCLNICSSYIFCNAQ